MLRQENQQLRVEQAEMMDAMKFQRASLEAKVYDLQQELEQQMFRTPESGDTVKRHLEMTVGEQEKEVDLEKERKRLYELTPMQQFEQLQSLMGTPAPGNRGGLAPFRAEQEAEATRPEEDEILQTRIIPNEEVFLNKADWIEAIVKEIKSLEEKKAIRRLTPQDVAYYRREHSDKLEVVPGKAIHSIKAPDARKKCRLVVCGNYLSGAGAGGAKQEAAQLYAGGADTTCLRAALAVGAQNDWTAAALDVKTAFLNAPLCTVEESKKKKLQALEDREEGGQQPMEQDVEEKVDPNRRERLVLMQPPRILIRGALDQVLSQGKSPKKSQQAASATELPHFKFKPSVGSWLVKKPHQVPKPWYYENVAVVEAEDEKVVKNLQAVIAEKDGEIAALKSPPPLPPKAVQGAEQSMKATPASLTNFRQYYADHVHSVGSDAMEKLYSKFPSQPKPAPKAPVTGSSGTKYNV
eukprot:g22659.t2